MSFILNLIFSAIAVFITARIIPGVSIDSFGTSVVVAVILGIANAIVKPILTVLTLPINILTLGLFSLVINAAIILLVDAVVPGFGTDGFLTALIFSIALSLITTLLYSIFT